MAVAESIEGPRLTLVGDVAPLVQWPSGGRSSIDPGSATGADGGGPVTITADVRTRRFAGNQVEEARYRAVATTPDRSPRAILAALADRFSAIEEGWEPGEADDRLIVEVRVVA